jgi:DNA-binding transcriptional regulator/RsmH inhibitor MraZ
MNEPLHGSFIYSLDRKGRVVIPSMWRDVIGSPVVLLPALELVKPTPYWTLLVISKSAWELQIEENQESHAWWNICGSMAWMDTYDKTTGRIMIPFTQRKICCLSPNEEVIVRGMGNAIQIIRYATWQDQFQGSVELSAYGVRTLLGNPKFRHQVNPDKSSGYVDRS